MQGLLNINKDIINKKINNYLIKMLSQKPPYSIHHEKNKYSYIYKHNNKKDLNLPFKKLNSEITNKHKKISISNPQSHRLPPKLTANKERPTRNFNSISMYNQSNISNISNISNRSEKRDNFSLSLNSSKIRRDKKLNNSMNESMLSKRHLSQKNNIKKVVKIGQKMNFRPASKVGKISTQKKNISPNISRNSTPFEKSDKKPYLKKLLLKRTESQKKKTNEMKPQLNKTATRNNSTKSITSWSNISQRKTTNIFSNINKKKVSSRHITSDLKHKPRQISKTNSKSNIKPTIAKNNILRHDNSNSSNDSTRITKNHISIIQKSDIIEEVKNEETIEKNTISRNVTKRIKCMHDLTQTGLSGDEKKINQDNLFIFKNFANEYENIYMGVWYDIYINL